MRHNQQHQARRLFFAALAGTAVALGAGCFADGAWAVPTKVTWEAEKPANREAPWTVKAASKNDIKKKLVAGTGYIRHPMLWPPKERPKDAKVPPKRLVYEFTVPKTATYYFWAKVWWYDECSNSFWVGFDKDVPAADWISLSFKERAPKEKTYVFGEDATYKRWHWVRYHSGDLATGGGVRLTKGKHKLYVRAREDGLSMDRFLLISDRDYIAVGQYG